MVISSPRRVSVSTWSLHRALGVTYPDSPDKPCMGERVETYGPGSVTLLDVPARLAAMGIRTLEICHFHLPNRESAYLNELKDALRQDGVQLFSLLIDTGDITHPIHHARDREWIAGWIETAGKLGAERARVVAGRQPCAEETMRRSREGLRALAECGQENGVRVTTENWYGLLEQPRDVIALLDSLEGRVGLNLDFGNWSGPTKYDDLAAIFPYAESCHAKCAFDAASMPDAADYRRCLDLARSAHFQGPFTLIYDGMEDDEWKMLQGEQEMVLPYLAA